MSKIRIRVLVTLYSTSWGGAEDSVLLLCERMAEKPDVSVSLLWVNNFVFGKPKVSPRVKLYFLDVSPLIYKFIAPVVVGFICLKDSINLVNHGFRYIKEESWVVKKLGIRNLVTLRAMWIDRINSNELRFVECVVGVSKAVVDCVLKLGYRGKTAVIYNGIDRGSLKVFDPASMDRSKVFCLCRLVEWKRIDWCIQAVKKLRKDGYPLTLDIYGEGKSMASLRALIKQLNVDEIISIKGVVDINDTKLSRYGIYLLASYAEPFGKSLLEAALRGKVIVATNYGGIPEILFNYDLLFSRDDFDDFVNKIKLAYNEWGSFRRKINSMRRDLQQKYTIEQVVSNYYRLYNMLISEEL